MKHLLLPVLLIWITSCSPKGNVDLTVSSNNLNVGDSLHVTVTTKEISTLVISMGDSTTFDYSVNGNETFELKHAYADTGSFLVRANGFTPKRSFTDHEFIEVE